jgi:ABC-type polysaccharide/polyol phosphate export permease
LANRTVNVLKANITRNLRIDWKYKLNLVTDLAWLVVDLIIFIFLGQMVAATTIEGEFKYDGKIKEFLVVGVIYWTIYTRAYKDGVNVIPDEAARGALGFIITNDVSLSDLITGQVTSSTIKTSFTLILFVLPLTIFLTFLEVLEPLTITVEIIFYGLVIILLSWVFMLSITIIASTLNVIFKKSGPLTYLLSYLVTLASGYYFPLEVLRSFNLGFLEEIFYFIPTTSMLYDLRSMLILGDVPTNIILKILYSAVFSVLIFILAIYIMRKITRRAAYSGTLEFY